MKKFLTFLLPVVALFAMASCSDEHDLPDVDFNFEIENATRVDGTLYVVQGDTLEVQSVTVVNREEGKQAMITAADYYWDYYYLGSNIQPPFGFEIFVDENTPVGEHVLEVECPLYAEDKEPATSVVSFRVQVVASSEDIPAGETTFTVTPKTSSTAEK